MQALYQAVVTRGGLHQVRFRVQCAQCVQCVALATLIRLPFAHRSWLPNGQVTKKKEWPAILTELGFARPTPTFGYKLRGRYFRCADLLASPPHH